MCVRVCAELSKSNYGDNVLNVPDGSFSYQRRTMRFHHLIIAFWGRTRAAAGTCCAINTRMPTRRRNARR